MIDIAELVKRADAETRNGDLGPDHIALFSQLAQALTAQAKEIAEKDAELLISDGIIAGLRLDVARLEGEVKVAKAERDDAVDWQKAKQEWIDVATVLLKDKLASGALAKLGGGK